MVISILGSGLNTNLLKLICTTGLAAVVCQECESGNNSNGSLPLLAIGVLVYSILAILRESTAAITNISKVLGSCIQKVMVFDNRKQLSIYMEVLQNTIIRGVTILLYYYATRESTTFPGTFRRENAQMHIYSRPRTSMLPGLTVLIHIPKILNLNARSRYSIISYIYIYLLFTVRGYRVTGRPLQRLFHILWSICL